MTKRLIPLLIIAGFCTMADAAVLKELHEETPHGHCRHLGRYSGRIECIVTQKGDILSDRIYNLDGENYEND